MISLPKFLCPALARSVSTQTVRASRRVKNPLVQNIEKLEVYIKSLEKTVKKQSLGAKESLQGETSDYDIAELYRNLSNAPRPALPAPRELLPSKMAKLMSLDTTAQTDKVDWDNAVMILMQSKEFTHLSSGDINAVLEAMPHHMRIDSGRRLVDQMAATPDRMTFDLLMNSYASCAKADEALAVFDQSRQAGLKPSLYSYAHLMKAFAVTKDLKRASAMYDHMRQENVEPNLVIYTSLIATCIRAGNTHRAFTIFEALKYASNESAPDTHIYSLMIHACSVDPNLSAERASDLFDEMTRKGLKPSRETFNSLIHVYALRPDFFSEAWRMSEMMQSNGIAMDKTTWHSLLSACVHHRDLKRARRLVIEMTRMSKTHQDWSPDAITYQLLFRAYAHASVQRSLVPANVVESILAVQVQDPNTLWIDQEPFRSDDLLQESLNIMTYLCKQKTELLSTQLIDTYMTIAQSFEAPARFKADWERLYKIHPKNRFSYEIGLRASYDLKDWELLQMVWSERQAWRALQKSSSPTSVSSYLTQDYGDFEAVRLYIESLSRLNRIQQASEVLDHARAEYVFEKRHLKCFQSKSLQVGDEDAVLLYRDMFPEQQRTRGVSKFYMSN